MNGESGNVVIKIGGSGAEKREQNNVDAGDGGAGEGGDSLRMDVVEFKRIKSDGRKESTVGGEVIDCGSGRMGGG